MAGNYQDKISNLRNGLGDSRARTVIIVIAVVAVVSAVIGYVELKKRGNVHLTSKAKVSNVPQISSVPGTGEPGRQYIKLQHKQNVTQAEQAIKTGGSAVPTMVRTTYQDMDSTSLLNHKNDSSCGIQFLKHARASGVTVAELRCRGCSAAALKAAGFSACELRYAGFTKQQLLKAGFNNDVLSQACTMTLSADGKPVSVSKKTANVTEHKKTVVAPKIQRKSVGGQLADARKMQFDQAGADEVQSNMTAQSADLFSSWTPLPQQQFVIKPDTETSASSTASSSAAKGNTQVVGNVVKAGTIWFAVLNTGINSDEKSPILATIVAGKYKGGKVLGTFTRQGEVVVLKFSTLSLPGLDHTIAINAYAINPDTARTAMASSVDNHYLLRYGSVLASAFLEGVGSAVQNSGSNLQVSATSGIVLNHPKLSAAQQGLIGLGKVGEKMGSNLSGVVNTPPTVRVRAGSSMGLLLMTDLTVPMPK